jgi:hypothetical protein
MEEKKRRQVSFNINDELYTEFKKLMLEDRTTPTAYITYCIKQRVEKGSQEKKEDK